MSLTDDILAVGAEKRGIEEAAILRGVLGIMEATPTGKMILADVARIGTEIRLDSAFNAVLGDNLGGVAERDGKRILFSEKLYRQSGAGASIFLLSTLVHESQHVRQFRRSAVVKKRCEVSALTSNIRDGLFLHRFVEADAVSAAAQVCFEAARKGIKVWDGPVPYPDFTSYTTCFRAFENEVRKNPASLVDGGARKAAFRAWFGLGDTKRAYEREYLAIATDSLAKAEGSIPFLREQVLELAGVPGGSQALQTLFPPPQLPVDAESQASLINILAMPDGRPYLDAGVFAARYANEPEPQSRTELEGIEKRLATLRRRIMPKPSQPPAPAPVICL